MYNLENYVNQRIRVLESYTNLTVIQENKLNCFLEILEEIEKLRKDAFKKKLNNILKIVDKS